ncbi:MAG: hypothetical protein KOO60_13965 [Gemmatimonadales bacterium]|nr:hypothetical protein [Gemmatimonadales bacterium]
MKKLVLAITIAMMAIGGVAMAGYNADNVGVYFDAAATDICMGNLTEVGISAHHVYVALTNMNYDTVMGFELALATDGPLALSNFAFPAGSGAVNVQSAPSFMVGFGYPLVVENRMAVIMEFDILIFSTNPVNWDVDGRGHVFVKNIFFHSMEEEVPAYVNGAAELVKLHQSTGTETDPVLFFSLYADGCENIPVSADEASWDSVKSLYR